MDVRCNAVAFATLAFIKMDFEASLVAVKGCWEVERDSCS
jgi:hypothetical protein